MSQSAKDKVLTIGARFSSLEHENAARIERDANQAISKKSNQTGSTSGKISFWKKGTGNKVPGR